MKITKLTLAYYQSKKVPRVGKSSFKFEHTIHEIINSQCELNTTGNHHNAINSLRLLYSNYKSGFITKQEFLDRLVRRPFNRRYYNRFL